MKYVVKDMHEMNVVEPEVSHKSNRYTSEKCDEGPSLFPHKM